MLRGVPGPTSKSSASFLAMAPAGWTQAKEGTTSPDLFDEQVVFGCSLRTFSGCSQSCVQIWPTPVQFSSFPKPAWYRSTPTQIWPKLDKFAPTLVFGMLSGRTLVRLLAKIGQASTLLGSTSTSFGPKSTKFGRDSADVPMAIWPEIGRCWPGLARNWVKIDRSHPGVRHTQP